MKSVCVFCGSSHGTDKVFESSAKKAAKVFLKEGVEFVYGGGNVGLMGVMAETIMNGGGKVTGVMPEFLMRKEHANLEISKLILVQSMHERKAKMSELSDGFMVMPGGLGTLEEFFEVWTWAQLELHVKPMGILNTDGYYDGLIRFIDKAVKKGFIKKADRDLIYIEEEPKKLLKLMREHFTENHKNGRLKEKS